MEANQFTCRLCKHIQVMCGLGKPTCFPVWQQFLFQELIRRNQCQMNCAYFYLFIYLFICLNFYLLFYLFIYSSIYSFIQLFSFLFIQLFLQYTLSKCPGGHPILHPGLKLHLKISAGKYEKKLRIKINLNKLRNANSCDDISRVWKF